MKRAVILIFLCLLVVVVWQAGLSDWLTLESVKAAQAELQAEVQARPLASLGVFSSLYVLVTALSIPGAALMTLLAGALFGWGVGVALVLLSATLGSLIAMLLARYLLRDWLGQRYRDPMDRVNMQIEKEGASYLLTLRLVPVFPFFLVNLLMGLTKMPWSRYAFVSAVGMAPGTMVYVNAGQQLATIDSLESVMAPELLAALILLAVLPWISKWLLARWSRFKLYRAFPKPTQFDYDVTVIGAGSGGLVAALIANTLKAKVALVESGEMGGDCLNTGCVPSKALLARASVASTVHRAAQFGVEASDVSIDFETVMRQVHSAIATIAPNDSEARYRALGVDVFKAEGQLVSPFEIEAGQARFTSRAVILATGASPILPALATTLSVPVLTSNDLWSLTECPARLMVVGGGAIGAEMAQAFQRLGSQVTLVEALPRLVSREEPEVSALLAQSLEADGIQVLCNASLEGMSPQGGLQVVSSQEEERSWSIEVDAVLFALGRAPDVPGQTMEALSLALGAGGRIEVNDYLQTNYPNVYAVGDVTGQYQLTHAASHMAWTAAVNALFGDLYRLKIDFSLMPSCIYTSPEIARVGATCAELDALNQPYEVTRFELSDLDRAITEGVSDGFVQVLTPPRSDRLLGVTIVAPHAGEMLSEFVLAMRWGLGLNKILATIHAYPTWSEANKRVAGQWRQKAKPEWALRLLARYHEWRRG